jgi:hypothetical protein
VNSGSDKNKFTIFSLRHPQQKGVFKMSAKTLSLKVIEIVGDNPDNFDEAKESQVKELLTPTNQETDIKKIEWRERKSSW